MKAGHIVLTLDIIRGRCVEEAECLLWPHCVNDGGIPYAQHEGRVVNVRRLVYALTHGTEAAPDLVLAMTCGHRNCLNAQHMRQMTRAKLVQRTAKAGKLSGPAANAKRTAAARNRPSNKLTAETAEWLREARGTHAELAAAFGVSESMVYRVKKGLSWPKQMTAASVFVLGAA